eukprot:TRINITY_DN1120_c0_g1_i1.p1 TRINITY_DN1120_c0_g1~~TRINITY_DN1120_c0_g1_i1.p1  ORF type:complete len:170 (-),score=54.79 TRINITY_DN1120_c0_g1_i1:245-754(-)
MSNPEVTRLTRSINKAAAAGGFIKLALMVYGSSGNLPALPVVAKEVVLSGLKVGFFAGQYNLLRLLLLRFCAKTSALPALIPGGVTGALLTFSPVSFYKEVLLYALKFVAEGLLNTFEEKKIWERKQINTSLWSKLSAIVLFSLLFYLYEYERKHLKPYVAKVLDFFFH